MRDFRVNLPSDGLPTIQQTMNTPIDVDQGMPTWLLVIMGLGILGGTSFYIYQKNQKTTKRRKHKSRS